MVFVPFQLGIQRLFQGITFVFYRHVAVCGEQNLPDDGVPTILAVNHTNGLADAVVTIANVRRFPRICAKDTLWKHPIFGPFIKASGAIPVQRAKEHGNKRDNKAVFHKVSEVLEAGANDMLGIFPEGGSAFRSQLLPLRPGVARMAIETVQRGKVRAVHIVPCGLTYLQREKFRSNVLMSLGAPIRVTASMAQDPDAAAAITEQLEHAMRSCSLQTPDFDTLAVSQTSLRLLLGYESRSFFVAYGTARFELPLYIQMLQQVVEFWTEDTDNDSHETVRQQVDDYQQLLDAKCLVDDRVFSESSRSDQPVSLVLRVLGLVLWTISCFGLAVPGLILWFPALILASRAESQKIASGLTSRMVDHADEIAEVKMMFGFLWTCLVSFTVFMCGYWLYGWSWAMALVVVTLSVMWLTVRFLEDAMAAVRAVGQLKAVLSTPHASWKQIQAQRSQLRERLIEITKPSGLHKLADTPAKDPNGSKWQHALSYFSPLRRRTTHWNEVLRMHWNAHSGMMADHERGATKRKDC